MKENLHHPGDHDEDENEDVVALQTPPDRLERADLERWQNQIFADQFLPFALQQMPILHHHRHEKMRLEHAHPGAKGVVESIASRLDPEHDPDDREVEKEDDVRHAGVGKRDGENRRGARDRPVGRRVEPRPPDHDPAELAAVKVRHRVDVALVVKTALDRVRRFVGRSVSFVRHAWRMIRLRRGARQSIN